MTVKEHERGGSRFPSVLDFAAQTVDVPVTVCTHKRLPGNFKKLILKTIDISDTHMSHCQNGTSKTSVQTSVTWTKDMAKDVLQTPVFWWLVVMPTAEGTTKALPNAPLAKAAGWDSSHIIPGTHKLSLTVSRGGGRLYFYKFKLYNFSFAGEH